MIPSTLVPIDHKEIIAAIKSINNKGNKITKFEQLFSNYVGSNYTIVTHSGLSALYILLRAYGVKKGDKVIMPAYMCESVARLILDMGYNLEFVDVEKETYNIDVKDLNEKINRKVKAVIAVHMFGNPCDMDDIIEIAGDYNAIVIEDSAQCIGAKYKGKNVGTIGNSGFFSLGEGKPMTTLNGGIIVTNDRNIAERSKSIINNFKNVSVYKKLMLCIRLFLYYLIKSRFIYSLLYSYITNRRILRREKLETNIDLNSFKYKFTEMQASIGIIQLSKIDYFNKIRKINAKFLMKHLSGLDKLHLPEIGKDSKPVFIRLPIYIENINVEQIDEIVNFLVKKGIDASVVYPNFLPKFFGINSNCHNANDLTKKTITLPVHPRVKENDLRHIVDAINEVVT